MLQKMRNKVILNLLRMSAKNRSIYGFICSTAKRSTKELYGNIVNDVLDIAVYLSLDELLNLYKSKSFSVTEILSDADEATDSATYLLSLIRKNGLLPKANNVVVYMTRGYEYDRIGNDGITYDTLRTEERQLYDAICEIVGQAEGVGTGDLIVDVIPDLGQQTLLYVACYN